MDETNAALQPGILFHGRYRIVRPIKTGGMGEVYEALDVRTNSPRALKVMLADTIDGPEQRTRFEQEAQVTGSIDSEHIVRISDAGVDGARPFLVMELLRGEEVQTLLDRSNALPYGEALLYLGQVARALEKTHAQSIVHRDLKPENLFVSRRDDGSACVKILDFGIAKIAAASQAKKTRSVGTPLYMAPEQILGDGSIGPGADLYALAHVAYCLLAGEAYWTEEASAHDTIIPLLKKVLGGPVEPPSARAMRRRRVRIPAAFDAWFLRAAAVNPAMRFPSASAQIDTLRALLLAPASGPFPAASSAAPQAASAGQNPAKGAATVSSTVYAPREASAAYVTAPPVGVAAPMGTGSGATSSGDPRAVAASPLHLPSAHDPMHATATTNDFHKGPPSSATLQSAKARPANRTALVLGGIAALIAVAGLGVAIGFAVSSSSPVASASATDSPSASASAPPGPRPTPSIDLVLVENTAPLPTVTVSLKDMCPPQTTCAELRVPDLEAAPLDDLLAQSNAFARKVDPSSSLLQFSAPKPRANATINLKEQGTFATYVVGQRQLNVITSLTFLMATWNDSAATVDGPLGTPCPSKAALDAAATKVAIAEVVTVAYMSFLKRPLWLVSTSKEQVWVDAGTCALTNVF